MPPDIGAHASRWQHDQSRILRPHTLTLTLSFFLTLQCSLYKLRTRTGQHNCMENVL